MKKLKPFLISSLLLLILTLQSCVFVAGAAAGAAAIAIVYDHRTINEILKDTRVANRVSRRISALVIGRRDDIHVQVTAFNGTILLTGQTPNDALRQQAGQVARTTPKVKQVYNQITIEGPSSTLTRTSDAWITTKIKSLMLANEDLKSGNIKVVTENGTVFLMGRLNLAQANIAVDIARRVTGVQRVIKVFQYK